jgi:hypothetical protein
VAVGLFFSAAVVVLRIRLEETAIISDKVENGSRQSHRAAGQDEMFFRHRHWATEGWSHRI